MSERPIQTPKVEIEAIKKTIDVVCGPLWKYGVVELRALDVNPGRFPETWSGYFGDGSAGAMAAEAFRLTTTAQAMARDRESSSALKPMAERRLTRLRRGPPAI
jgi:hypothetical protein